MENLIGSLKIKETDFVVSTPHSNHQRKFIMNSTNLGRRGEGGDAGGKREAANKPDQGEGYRAAWGRAARGDRAGWQLSIFNSREICRGYEDFDYLQ